MWQHQHLPAIYKKKAGDEDPDLFEEAAKSWETVVEAAEYAETGLNVLIWAMLHWLGSLMTFCASFAFSIRICKIIIWAGNYSSNPQPFLIYFPKFSTI